MIDLVPKVEQLWSTERDKVNGSAEQISARLTTVSQPRAGGAADPQLPDRAYRELASRYDPSYGGFGSAPKFPSPHTLLFLSRYSVLANQPQAMKMVDHTLEEMRRGGIFDQVGFGFHRYSTDAEWLVPHFEKMLYDQAMLVLASTEAFLAGGTADHRQDGGRGRHLRSSRHDLAGTAGSTPPRTPTAKVRRGFSISGPSTS